MEQDKSWWPRWNQSVNVFFIFIFIFINVFFIFFANRVTWRLSVQADCHGVFQWPEDRHAAGLQILSPAVTLVSTWDQIKSPDRACHYLFNRAANDPWVLQSHRRPLPGPFPGLKRLVELKATDTQVNPNLKSDGLTFSHIHCPLWRK